MLRGKLADEGMLNEDICLGTKATTQRSDTWKTKVKSGYYFRIPVAVDEAVFFFIFLPVLQRPSSSVAYRDTFGQLKLIILLRLHLNI